MDKCIDQILTLQKRPKQRTAEPKFKGEMRGQHSKRNAMDGMEKGRKRWKKVLQGFRIQRAIFCHSDTHIGKENCRASALRGKRS